MLPRPQFQAHERPNPFGVIPRPLFMLIEQTDDLAAVGPPALVRAAIEENLPRPSDQSFGEPSAQWDAEPHFRTSQRVGREPAGGETALKG